MTESSKPSLSKDQILKRALRVLHEQGPKALSFRTIAKSLDVTAMAIVHHVGSKKELLEGLIKLVYRDVDFFPNDVEGKEKIRAGLARYWDFVSMHPELTLAIFENQVLGHLSEFTGEIRSLLMELVSKQEASLLLNLIIDYTHGHTLSAAAFQGENGPSKQEYLEGIDWILERLN